MATAEPFGRYDILGAATKEAVLPVPAAASSAFLINGIGEMSVVSITRLATGEIHRKLDKIDGRERPDPPPALVEKFSNYTCLIWKQIPL